MGKASDGRRLCFHVHGRRSYSVYKHSTGYWYADYSENHKRNRVSLRVRTRREAEQAVRRLDEPDRPAEIGDGGAAGIQDLSLIETRDMYIEHCENKDLAPRSVARYRAALDALLRHCADVGVAQARDLALPVLEGFTSYRRKQEGRAPKTVYTDSMIIKDFLKYASHSGRRLMADNPGEAWEVRKPPKKQGYCYTEEEVEALIKGCRDWLRPIVTTLAYTGLRIDELIELRWEDVDLCNGLISIRVRDDWRPKGKRDRSIPIYPLVRGAIESRPLGEFVFLGPLGGRLTESNTLKCLKEDREKLEIAQGVLHSFRHFFVSMCAQSGVAIFTCMSWVGHKDSDMVWYYYHLHDKASKDAMERLAASRGVTPDGKVVARYQDRNNRRRPLGKKLAKSGS
ncbi:MAG: tyrosine-type recombinase/integrase [Planctomycetota bacterium]|jgi:integrase/recombinase XerD